MYLRLHSSKMTREKQNNVEKIISSTKLPATQKMLQSQVAMTQTIMSH